MKQLPQRNENSRFSGNLRHYHRSGPGTHRTWDEWVDGKSAKPGSTRWVKISVVIVALLALGGVVAGLVIELR